MVKGWRYYNHAMLPTCAPHEEPNMEPINNNTVFTHNYTPGAGHPLLARWTSDYDCGYETQWWYCIKDTPFDINTINSKKRYEINKGKKNFNVKVITPKNYIEELYKCTLAAYSSWPRHYRPSPNESGFSRSAVSWNEDENVVVLGAFSRDSNDLRGYALLHYHPKCVYFSTLRVYPECEKNAINAALVAGVCEYCEEDIEAGIYVVDGERNTLHETNFQEYLEKYFDFRKAYCKLNIKYRGFVGLLVSVLYPIRHVLSKVRIMKVWQKVEAILFMEEIIRRQRGSALH